MFNQQIAEDHLNALLQKHNITVYGWSATSCGRAKWKKREIKIPHPTNADRFGVCMHEIKHIIDGNKGKRFEQEFACDMFAREQMILIGTGGIAEWDKRTNWHCLSRIAMAVNRGLRVNKIGLEIRSWFVDVDFNTWRGMKVFIRMTKTGKGYTITLTQNFAKWEIERLLARKGMWLDKSEIDDSTYGRWVVRSNDNQYGSDFDNLSEIVSRYQLSI